MDLASDTDGNPFGIREQVWSTALSILCSPGEQQGTLFHNIDFDLPTLHIDDVYVPLKEETHDLTLPNLYEFDYASLPSLDPIPDTSVENSFASSAGQEDYSNPASNVEQEPVEDIWRNADALGPVSNDIKYLTWEKFSDPTQKEEIPLFLSEAGPGAFDAALQFAAEESEEDVQAGRPVQRNAFVRSLWQLSFGRASILFPYDEEKREFYPAIDNGRLSGYSLPSSTSITNEFLVVANATKELRGFVDASYSSRILLPGVVTLANAVALVLDATETYLVAHEKEIQTLLQLQALLEKPKQIVLAVKDVVSDAKLAGTNEEILLAIFAIAEKVDTSSLLSGLMAGVLAKVSQPWLTTLEEQIGLRQTYGTTALINESQNNTLGDESLLTESEPVIREPNFLLPKDDESLLSASNKCLSFMKEHHPEHPLCSGPIGIEAPKMELAFDWADIERIESKASQYLESLQSSIAEHNSSISTLIPKIKKPVGTGKVTIKDLEFSAFDYLEDLDLSISTFKSLPLLSSQHLQDDLYNTTTNLLSSTSDHTTSGSSSTLPLSLIAHLSLRPYLHAQHHLLTTASLRSVLLKHSVRTHLDLCHGFHLCSSGFFTSRMSSVLFDPSFETVERQRNTLRSGSDSMGLKLGSGQRRDWPPASSELRLALRGVLTETWHVSSSHPANEQQLQHDTKQPRAFEVSGSKDRPLPGGLSFALRSDLKSEEIDRVLDPHSIYALDFLSLSYTPPRALEAVFTSPCLDMYSRVFRLMLRLLRMGFVVGQIYRDTTVNRKGKQRLRGAGSAEEILIDRFRHECSYFINTLTAHFLSNGIGKPWTVFGQYLNDLENVVCGRNTPAAHVSGDFSLAGLTAMHESTLRTITTALFLRNRQRKASVSLETLCDTILQFARVAKDGAGDSTNGNLGRLEELRKLYSQFKEQRADFITTCASLSDKAEFGGGKGRDRSSEDGTLAVRDLVESLQGARSGREKVDEF